MSKHQLVTAFDFSNVCNKLRSFQPYLVDDYKNFKSASVCMILSDFENDGELSILMIRRAKFQGDPWSGHMAFPGGRVEAFDDSIRAGALRELSEELQIGFDQLEPLGQLSDVKAKMVPKHKQLVISAFVFKAKHALKPIKNEEVAEYHWIPLRFFAETRRKRMWWMRKLRPLVLPYYRYNKRRVWGLSLAMIDELFKVIEQPISRGRSRRQYRDKPENTIR